MQNWIGGKSNSEYLFKFNVTFINSVNRKKNAQHSYLQLKYIALAKVCQQAK